MLHLLDLTNFVTLQNKTFPEEPFSGCSFPPHKCSMCSGPDDPCVVQSLPTAGSGKSQDPYLCPNLCLVLNSSDTDLVLQIKKEKLEEELQVAAVDGHLFYHRGL